MSGQLNTERYDAVRAVDRVLCSRCGQRMREALLRYLEGLSAREAARRSGYFDHKTLLRNAHRLQLNEIHEQRRRDRALLRSAQKGLQEPRMQKLMRGEKLSTRELIAVYRDSSEWLQRLGGLDDF